MLTTRFSELIGCSVPIQQAGMGGAIARMLPPFKLFAGGPIGSGKQWFSWIHQADQVRAFNFIQET